jgi:hypothetical protein
MSSGKMSCWANVFLGKRLMGKYFYGQMSFWANVLRANIFMGKCLMGNRLMGKCPWGQMSFWSNVFWVNVLWANVVLGKCLCANVSGQMSHGQMSAHRHDHLFLPPMQPTKVVFSQSKN